LNGVERGEIEEKVLKILRPSSLQLKFLSRFYKIIKTKLENCLASEDLKAIVEAEGSFAKGTLLSDKWELDVFVIFKDVTEEWILKKSERILRQCLDDLPHSIRYAQHPYITVYLMGMQADVVPVVFVEKPTGGLGVERTPFHTRYVKRKISERPWLADEVRLLKSFLRGIEAYGAETSIGGFSGYLAELLTIHYGSFRNVLKAASKWTPGTFVDPEGVGDEQALRRKYKDSVLIVVDPVDPERNAAAALTLEKFSTFVTAAKAYLRRPCEKYFHVFSKSKKLKLKEADEVMSRTIMIYFVGNYYEMPRDALLGKLKSLSRKIKKHLEDLGFNVIRYKFYTDEHERAVIFLELLTPRLPLKEVMVGPYAWNKDERVINFIRKRLIEGGYVWVDEKGRLMGLRKRKETDAIKLINKLLSENQPISGTKSLIIAPARDARGWSRKMLERFILDVPAWISCLY
jgi:tRNA nucleotidyltransferase (CCA-adding enzyme)